MTNRAPQHRSTIDVMQDHVSVRRFTDEPVGHDVLETLIEAGTRASTSSNMQMYSVISITEPNHKARVAKLCADQPQIHQSAAFLAFCVDLHKIELCTLMHDESCESLSATEALIAATVDTALFMQNVAVAAESIGLGICMIGAMRNHPTEVRDALGLPKHVFALAGMCIGWPSEKGDPKPRLPIDAVWHRERYRGDEDIVRSIRAYDGILAAFYESQGMHPKENRWSRIMCKKAAGLPERAEVGRLIRAQGLDQPAS